MNVLVMNCGPVRDGATAEIEKMISVSLKERYHVKRICIDDFEMHFCKGCRACHHTAECVQHDGVDEIMAHYE